MGKAAALLLLVLACVASSAAQHAVHVKLEVAVSLRSWQDDDLVPPFLRQLSELAEVRLSAVNLLELSAASTRTASIADTVILGRRSADDASALAARVYNATVDRAVSFPNVGIVRLVTIGVQVQMSSDGEPYVFAEREASGTAASDSNSADEQLTVAIIVLGIILLLIVVIVAFAAVRQQQTKTMRIAWITGTRPQNRLPAQGQSKSTLVAAAATTGDSPSATPRGNTSTQRWAASSPYTPTAHMPAIPETPVAELDPRIGRRLPPPREVEMYVV